MAEMTAVQKLRPEPGINITKIATPEPQKDEVLVKVLCSSICGTDVGIYDWGDWAKSNINPPVVIGHELVGRVEQINSSKPVAFKEGDLVSSETHIYCGKCQQCLSGNKHICENMQLFGISRNGAFAEYATIPIQTVWKNDASLVPELMSIQEPLGNAVHLVTKAEVANKRVLILGLGPVGLCAGVVAKHYGAKEVVAIEQSEYRREIGHSLGLHYMYEKFPTNLPHSFDIVFEMSGNATMIAQGFTFLRPGGTFMAFGIPKDTVQLNWGDALISKEITIKSVFGRKIWDTWHEVQNILLNSKINLMPLITHSYLLDEIEEAIIKMKSGQCGKIIVYPER